MSNWLSFRGESSAGAGDGETEAQFRKFVAQLFSGSGVFSGMTVTQTTTASGSVVVSAGMAVLEDSTGAYPLMADASYTLNVLGANPVGSSVRTDLIVADKSSPTAPVLVLGTSGSSTAPTPTSSQVLLAQLNHTASATTVTTARIDNTVRSTCYLTGVNTVSPWINLSLASGYTSPSGNVPGYRITPWGVQLRGSAQKGSALAQGDQPLATFPAAIRPSATTYLTAQGGTSTTVNLQLTSAGALTVKVVPGTSVMYLDSILYGL